MHGPVKTPETMQAIVENNGGSLSALQRNALSSFLTQQGELGLGMQVHCVGSQKGDYHRYAFRVLFLWFYWSILT